MPVSLNLPSPVCLALARFCRVLRGTRAAPAAQSSADYIEYQYRSSEVLRRRFFPNIDFENCTVADVGSGLGGRAPFFIEAGARRVYCIDINRAELATGRQIIAERFPAVAERIEFAHPDGFEPGDGVDLAMLVDAFEHLVDPAAALAQMYRWLRPGGVLWIGSFGWYHYQASHCLEHIPIPWCQLFFSEKAILNTIRAIIHARNYQPNLWERLEGLDRWDGVTTLRNRPGEPLNMLSLRAVKQALRSSPFKVRSFQVYGLRSGRGAAGRMAKMAARLPVVNEVFHSYYAAVLVKPHHVAATAETNRREPRFHNVSIGASL